MFTNISRRTWPEHCSVIGIVFHVYIIILLLKDGSHVTLIMNPRESCTGVDCTVHRHVYWQGFMTQLLNILVQAVRMQQSASTSAGLQRHCTAHSSLVTIMQNVNDLWYSSHIDNDACSPSLTKLIHSLHSHQLLRSILIWRQKETAPRAVCVLLALLALKLVR